MSKMDKKKAEDMMLTATTLNFLRICDKYAITMDDICEDIDRVVDTCSMCNEPIKIIDPVPEKLKSSSKRDPK
jgi:hypothetical protein